MNAIEMRAKAREAYNRADVIEKTARTSGRDMNAEESKNFDLAMDDAESWAKRAQRVEGLGVGVTGVAAAAAGASRPGAAGVSGKSIEGGGAEDDDEEVVERTPKVKRAEHKAFRAGMLYGRQAMEFTRGEMVRKALSKLALPEGGFLLTEEMRAGFIERLRNVTQMRSLATVVSTNAASMSARIFDYDADAPVRKPVLGTTNKITKENVTNAFGKTRFIPHQRARIFLVPRELLEDGDSNAEQILTQHFARRFGELQEEDFVSGNGVEKPLGINIAGGISTVESSASGAAVGATDVWDTVYSIKAQYRNSAACAWLMNRTTVKLFRKLRDDSGGAGTGNFLWQPGLQPGQPASLGGFRLVETEFLPAAAATGDTHAIFGDFSYYWIVDKRTLEVRRLEELYAEENAIGVQFIMHTDGAPVLAECFIKLKRKA
jgi:HK97 family phage major capsid protein